MKKFKKSYPFILLVIFLIIKIDLPFSTTLEYGVSSAIYEENNPSMVSLFTILIENKKDGEIKLSEDGENWQIVGRVIQPAEKVQDKGYTASVWAKNSTVAATAVNSIHIKVGHNKELNSGIIFSILPQELMLPPKDYKSYLSPSSSIFTDIKAGDSIFGGGFAPFVGNPVYIKTAEGLKPLSEDYIPSIGDNIIILVQRPKPYPAEIIFENRFGGFIKIKYPEGKEKIIGEVLKPVQGVGRFSGTLYTTKGRIRANHCGVIDVSTSLYGEVGGFQIIPANHGMSPEMENARLLTQWMVIGPTSVWEPSMEGTAPLFSYFIKPDYDPFDIYKDNWYNRLLQRFLVQVKIRGKGDKWQPIPNLTGRVDNALSNITEVRILFPIYSNQEKRRNKEDEINSAKRKVFWKAGKKFLQDFWFYGF